MGNKTLVYKEKVTDNLNESYKHLLRLENVNKPFFLVAKR